MLLMFDSRRKTNLGMVGVCFMVVVPGGVHITLPLFWKHDRKGRERESQQKYCIDWKYFHFILRR